LDPVLLLLLFGYLSVIKTTSGGPRVSYIIFYLFIYLLIFLFTLPGKFLTIQKEYATTSRSNSIYFPPFSIINKGKTPGATWEEEKKKEKGSKSKQKTTPSKGLGLLKWMWFQMWFKF